MHIETKSSNFFILKRNWVENKFIDQETCFWSCRKNVSRSKSWISRASWWFRSKTTINVINLMNFAYRNSWRLLKNKSMSMKAGYTSAKGIQSTASIIPAFAKSFLLRAALEFCLYRLNVILPVSWTKCIAGNSVWICYIDQMYFILF